MAEGFTGRTAWARSIQTPLRNFLQTETGGAAVLLAASAAALVLVNADRPSCDSRARLGERGCALVRLGVVVVVLDSPRALGHRARPARMGERGLDDVLLL